MAKNKNNKPAPSDCGQQKTQSCKDMKQENKKTNTPANASDVYTK